MAWIVMERKKRGIMEGTGTWIGCEKGERWKEKGNRECTAVRAKRNFLSKSWSAIPTQRLA